MLCEFASCSAPSLRIFSFAGQNLTGSFGSAAVAQTRQILACEWLLLGRSSLSPLIIRALVTPKELDMFTSRNVPAEREPWNKGKLIGPKHPLSLKQIWSIRHCLKTEDRRRDLALFNLAIDSKLRACDLLNLRVSDISSDGQVNRRATIQQQKTIVQFNSRLRIEPDAQSINGLIRQSSRLPSSCSLVVSMPLDIFH
jgi:integrase